MIPTVSINTEQLLYTNYSILHGKRHGVLLLMIISRITPLTFYHSLGTAVILLIVVIMSPETSDEIIIICKTFRCVIKSHKPWNYTEEKLAHYLRVIHQDYTIWKLTVGVLCENGGASGLVYKLGELISARIYFSLVTGEILAVS